MIKRFLAEWLAWAEAGAPEHKVFRRFAGLCYNFKSWMIASNNYSDDLAVAFKNLFENDYPFGGYFSYEREAAADTIHLNEQRLAWVKGKLNEL